MSKPKKRFLDEATNGFFDNGYYVEPAKNQKALPASYLSDLYGRMLQAQESKSSTLSLTRDDITRGAINAVYNMGEGRNFDFVPTYDNRVVLPEITITPNNTTASERGTYYDPLYNTYWRKRKRLSAAPLPK